MEEQLIKIREEALKEIAMVIDMTGLDSLRIKYLGRKGKLTSLLGQLKNLSLEEKRKIGPLANQIKREIEGKLKELKEQLKEFSLQQLEKEKIDINLPAIGPQRIFGHFHLISDFKRRLINIFFEMGYEILEGPDIDTDYYNFESLNIPKNHPAREAQDTFYFDFNTLLRTHTTNMQAHVMKQKKPPVKYVVIGRVYRRDDDPTHSFMFHQIDGLVVDRNIKLSDLKGVLTLMIKKLLGQEVKIRLRSSYFPFTEPSLEVDISCILCQGKGCGICKNTGWLEVAGAGMVHPQVFKNVGYNYKKVSGLAFGAGIERLIMLKHRIDNIKLFFENDLRFLRQF